jgi:hypothetical protein
LMLGVLVMVAVITAEPLVAAGVQTTKFASQVPAQRLPAVETDTSPGLLEAKVKSAATPAPLLSRAVVLTWVTAPRLRETTVGEIVREAAVEVVALFPPQADIEMISAIARKETTETGNRRIGPPRAMMRGDFSGNFSVEA